MATHRLRERQTVCPVDAPVDVPRSNEQLALQPSDLLPLLQGIAALVETQRELTQSILALAQSQSEMARAMSEDQDFDPGPMSTKR